jgi:hypothetical protein
MMGVYQQKKKKNTGSKGGPSMNEVFVHARPHYNVHSTLEVDIGDTSPRWKVDSIKWGEIGREGGE